MIHKRVITTFSFLGLILIFSLDVDQSSAASLQFNWFKEPLEIVPMDAIAAQQVIPTISGEIEVVEIPSSLDGGEFISQTHIRLMDEGPGVVTAAMLDFQYDGAYHDPDLPIASGDNTFGNAIVTPYSGPGLPAVGTKVYSILLYFDPDLSDLPFSLTEGIARSATITFDHPILGVYVTSGALNVADNIFSPSGVTFPLTVGRDMEFNYDGDVYAISPDRYQLSVTLFSHNGGVLDEMWIIFAQDSEQTRIDFRRRK